MISNATYVLCDLSVSVPFLLPSLVVVDVVQEAGGFLSQVLIFLLLLLGVLADEAVFMFFEVVPLFVSADC